MNTVRMGAPDFTASSAGPAWNPFSAPRVVRVPSGKSRMFSPRASRLRPSFNIRNAGSCGTKSARRARCDSSGLPQGFVPTTQPIPGSFPKKHSASRIDGWFATTIEPLHSAASSNPSQRQCKRSRSAKSAKNRPQPSPSQPRTPAAPASGFLNASHALNIRHRRRKETKARCAANPDRRTAASAARAVLSAKGRTRFAIPFHL